MKNKKSIIYIITITIIIIVAFILINNINNNKGSLTELNYKEVKEKISNKDSFILVISRTSCSHCATYKPKLNKIANKYNITVYYIDYDKEKEKNQNKLFEDLDLDGSTPTTIFIKKGKQTSLFDRINGDLSEETIIKRFKEMKYIK